MRSELVVTDPNGPWLNARVGDGNGLGGRALLPPLNIPYLPDFLGGGCLGPAGDCAN